MKVPPVKSSSAPCERRGPTGAGNAAAPHHSLLGIRCRNYAKSQGLPSNYVKFLSCIRNNLYCVAMERQRCRKKFPEIREKAQNGPDLIFLKSKIFSSPVEFR